MAIAFRASATSTGATITIPAGAAAGDFAVLFQQSSDTVSISEVIPSGWTQGSFSSSFNTGGAGSPPTRWNGCYRTLQAGDPGSSVTGMDGDSADAKIMLVFYGSTALSGVTLGDVFGEPLAGDIASQTISAASGTAPLVVLGLSGCNNAAGTFSTASPAFDAEVTSGNLRAGYKVYTSSPSDHTIDKTDQGQRNFLGGLYVQLRETQPLTPSLFTNTNTFYSATVTPGSVGLTPSLYTNTNSFFSPTVTSVKTLTPSLFTNTNSFFSPTVTATKTLTPSLYTNTNTFYSPTAAQGPVYLTPSLYTNSQSFYSPTVLAGTVTLSPSLYTNTNTFFSPTATYTYTLTPSLYTNSSSFYSPTVLNVNTLTPSLYTNSQTFYSPTVTVGAVDLTPNLFTNTQTFYQPTVSTSYILTPDLYTNTNTFFSPTVEGGVVTILPSLYTNSNEFFSPAVLLEGETLNGNGIIERRRRRFGIRRN